MYKISTAKPIISTAIPIITHQYSLKNIQFDPTQNSPPSLWKMRLNKRIDGENHLKNVSNNISNNISNIKY